MQDTAIVTMEADMPTFENEKEESKNRGAEGGGVWGGGVPLPTGGHWPRLPRDSVALTNGEC